MPFVGGAKQKFNSGVNYKKIINSTPAVKSNRVLNRLPRNLQDSEAQSQLREQMFEHFTGKKNQAKSTSFSTRNVNTTMSVPSESFAYGFDHGFDLPATVQLSRIGRKVDRWEKTSELINERKVQREIWAKSILKKEEKVWERINNTNTKNTKIKKEDWGKKNETR
jgi:hypothetical protein